jgi:hypothetical protein
MVIMVKLTNLKSSNRKKISICIYYLTSSWFSYFPLSICYFLVFLPLFTQLKFSSSSFYKLVNFNYLHSLKSNLLSKIHSSKVSLLHILNFSFIFSLIQINHRYRHWHREQTKNLLKFSTHHLLHGKKKYKSSK